jgi:hypothetical protein
MKEENSEETRKYFQTFKMIGTLLTLRYAFLLTEENQCLLLLLLLTKYNLKCLGHVTCMFYVLFYVCYEKTEHTMT